MANDDDVDGGVHVRRRRAAALEKSSRGPLLTSTPRSDAGSPPNESFRDWVARTDATGGRSQNGNVLLASHRHSNELGFRHWVILVLGALLVFLVVVGLHHRMPNVVRDAEDPGHERFSEERSRRLLDALVKLGPRPSGSEAAEVHARREIESRLQRLKKVAEKSSVNRLELDTHAPTGCFDLKFLSSFTLCYHKVTNIVARIGPASGATDSALLLNCHFDSMPDTPGATDDAVSCAIMMEVLDVLAHSGKPLENDIVFLFNGAEENFLQGAHGFVEQHAWRHSVKAFINLEGTGAGGREILFQAGPGNAWLLKTYLESVPHSHCSVLAQEIFQSGVIPSDTDFRVFRDHGRVSGLDIAYSKNGWVYHTEFDTPDRIEAGAVQRAGENVLALTRALVASPYLRKASLFDGPPEYVFYDVAGLFNICYPKEWGTIFNWAAVIYALVVFALHIKRGTYSAGELLAAVGHELLALGAMTVVTALVLAVVTVLGVTMTWYKAPELVGLLYILPGVLTGMTVHSALAHRQKVSWARAEQLHADASALLWAALLAALTAAGLASAFLALVYLGWPLVKDPLLALVATVGGRKINPQLVWLVQLICLVPVAFFASYVVSISIDFFVPVMGRLGNAVNPDLVLALLALTISITVVLHTNNLVYASRRLNWALGAGWAFFVLGAVILVTTRLHAPYSYTPEAPRLRRIIALHALRTVHPWQGVNATTADESSSPTKDVALFVQSLDYRGTGDLPTHSFIDVARAPNCVGIKDEYCRLPYYTAVNELFPPKDSLWVPVPTEPDVPFPIKLRLAGRKEDAETVTLSFELTGGYDKMSLHVTPLQEGYEFEAWSFTKIRLDDFGRRATYFVFLTYGQEAPAKREFWIRLRRKNPSVQLDKEKPILELSVASHHAHGRYQDSQILTQLRKIIRTRREQTHQAIDWWKWGITMIGGVTEIAVHQF